jgi:DNA polymerase-3 subunit alpha
VAGYTLGSADLLRRAMGKKKVEEMDAQRATFISGATKNNLNERQANDLFDLLEKFAGYGFNKSHAAAYAKIAYQTAYLKTHYASSFIAASMSADMNNTDNVHLLFDDCARNKVELLPPNINQSQYKFVTVNQDQILYGLGALKGSGQIAIEEILQEREENGPFKSLFDFTSRLDLRKVNRRVIESLIKAGAFDEIEKNRASLLASIGLAINFAEQANANVGQNNLFEASEEQAVNLVSVESWDTQKQLLEEKEALGFYFSGHPFTYYKKMIREFIPTKLSELIPRESPYLVAGIISDVRFKMTSRGKIAIITLDDSEGRMDMVVGSKVLNDFYDLIKEDQLLFVEGRVSHDDFTGGNRINVIKAFDLLSIQSTKAQLLKITLDKQANPDVLKNLLKPFCNGAFGADIKKCRVKVEYQNQQGKVELMLGPEWSVALHEDLIFGLVASYEDDNVKILYN